jgi:hypothetical protein
MGAATARLAAMTAAMRALNIIVTDVEHVSVNM